MLNNKHQGTLNLFLFWTTSVCGCMRVCKTYVHCTPPLGRPQCAKFFDDKMTSFTIHKAHLYARSAQKKRVLVLKIS